MRNKRFISGPLVIASLVLSLLAALGVIGAGMLQAHAAGLLNARISDYSIPAGYDPWGIALDSTNHVYVAIPDCDPTPQCSGGTYPGYIAVMNPTSHIWAGSYQLPNGYGQPFFLNFAPNGKLWFAMPMSNAIGRFNTSSHTFTKWTVPTANSGPWDVVVDHNGIVWFTEHYTNKIGRFDPKTQQFQEITTAANSWPYGITVDAGNNIWFTENNDQVAQIGEVTAQGQLREYKIRSGSTSGLTPHLIVVDPNGNVWWTEGWASGLGELRVSQAQPGTNQGVTEYFYKGPCSSCASHTSGIGLDGKGNIWFDDSLQNVIGTFPLNGSGSFSFANAPTSNGHPHDGLVVDPKNRVWFSEEFANKVAVAIPS